MHTVEGLLNAQISQLEANQWPAATALNDLCSVSADDHEQLERLQEALEVYLPVL